MDFILMPPAIVVYVNSLPDLKGGITNGPVVRIVEKYRSDVGIRMHELEHVKQWWLSGILMSGQAILLATLFNMQAYLLPMLIPLAWSVSSVLYLLFKPYRQWVELQAYAVQLQYSTDKNEDARLFGLFISQDYGLSITAKEATEKLKGIV